MIGRLLGTCALSAAANFAAASDLSPTDFAYGMPVVTPVAAAAYRVALPAGVYEHTARMDLADVRVFNARGEVVPYALSRPPAGTVGHGPGTALPLFALRGDSAAAVDAIRLTIDSPNAAVKLQTQGRTAADGGIAQYIVDGRALKVPAAAMQLSWPEGAADFSGRLRIEASDDFASWRTIAQSEPIANLHANGEQLVNNRLEFTATAARYWRLSWIGESAPFELTALIAESADSRVEAERATLEVAGSTQGLAPGEHEFDLGARLPIERLDLRLPELNTVVAVELLSRMRPQDPWRHIDRRQFYRVATAAGELRNQPIVIAADTDRYWLARAAGPAAAGPIRLQAAWTPSDMVFLARGPGPFVLAYGSSSAPAAETDLSSVTVAVTILRATLGVSTELGGPQRLAAPAAEIPWKQVLLWAVLVLSVCLLAWMAYRLSKDIGGGAPG